MKNLASVVKKFEKLLQDVIDELRTLPEGALVKQNSSYYHKIGNKKIGITGNKEMLCKLCRKKFLLAFQNQLKNNLFYLTRSPEKMDFTLPIELIKTFSSTYQSLPLSNFYHPSVKGWLSAPVKKNLFKPEECKYQSSKGIGLRSKSEVFIADKLEAYGLLYKYDTLITLRNKTIAPDFNIINPFTGNMMMWEHYGATHIEKYAKNMDDKMDLYLRNGYIPFETIIYTFESDVRNPERLAYLIENIIF